MSTPWHGCRYAQETPAGSEEPQARAAGAATGAGTAPASGADHTDTEPQITWRRQAYQQTCHHDRRFHRAPATGFQWLDNTELFAEWHFIRVESGRVTPLARPVNLPETRDAPFSVGLGTRTTPWRGVGVPKPGGGTPRRVGDPAVQVHGNPQQAGVPSHGDATPSHWPLRQAVDTPPTASTRRTPAGNP